MIHLTRLNRVPFVVNAELIEHIETTPDTVVVLSTGQKFLVLESADEVVRRVVAYRSSVLRFAPEPASIAITTGEGESG